MLVGCLWAMLSVRWILPYPNIISVVMCFFTQILLIIIGKYLNIFHFKTKMNLVCIVLFAVISFVLFMMSYTWSNAIMYSLIMRNFH